MSNTFTLLGIDDEVTTCDLCGKADLKCTMVLAELDADGSEVGIVRYGRDCGAQGRPHARGGVRMTTKPALPGWTMPAPPWPCCVAVAFKVEGEWDVGWLEDGEPVDHYLVMPGNRIGWPFGLFEGATAEDLRALGFQVMDEQHRRQVMTEAAVSGDLLPGTVHPKIWVLLNGPDPCGNSSASVVGAYATPEAADAAILAEFGDVERSADALGVTLSDENGLILGYLQEVEVSRG